MKTTMILIDVDGLLQRQLSLVEEWHKPECAPENSNSFYQLVYKQHRTNFKLWHEEDKARDPNASDNLIATVKRSIDRLNQKRNDEIEEIDEELLKKLQQNSVKILEDATLNSETPGSIIDRLSINALKIYHMDEEIQRRNVADEHRKKCSVKLSVLNDQRNDLKKSLETLLADLKDGKKRMKVYQQMKMYNDENLNPILYQKEKNK